MSSQLDKSLDEITAERRTTTPRGPRHGGGRRGGVGGGGGGGGGEMRQEIRRSAGGVQKRRTDSYTSPAVAARGSSDDAWTHDLYDRNGDRRAQLANNPLAARLGEITVQKATLKVENLHYDLSEDDLTDLFNKIGPVERLRLKYDKAGRSDGVAFVTYTSIEDANEAIRKYNGANAAGQPITVTLDVEAPRRPASSPVIRGPRVGGGGGSRGFTRGPRFGGGARMDTGRGGRGGGGGDRNPRQPRRTQEDLDKELDDFMSGPPPAAENGTGSEEMAVD